MGISVNFTYKPIQQIDIIPKESIIKDKKPNKLDEIEITDDKLAKLFKQSYGKDFVYIYDDENGKFGTFYYYDTYIWKIDRNSKHLNTIIPGSFFNKIHKKLSDRLTKCTEKYERINIMDTQQKLKSLQFQTRIRNIIERLKHHLHNPDIKFNQNPYILVFENGVYDLENFKFKKQTERSEYISNKYSTGYNYEDYDEDKMKEFKTEYIDKIFINDLQDRNVFFKLISTILVGKRYKKYIIANGTGDNGKSGFMALSSDMLGNYAYKINVRDLCVGKKDIFELNNIKDKRLVFCEEPDESTQKFDGNFIKEITGSDVVNFRQMYNTDNSEVNLALLLVICCNKKPPINCFDSATRERTIDFPFLSTFTDTDINNTDRFAGKEYYDTKEFRNKSRILMFHYLIPYLKLFFEDKQKIKLTKNLEQRRENYLLESDELYCWFKDNYTIIEDENDKSYITMKDLFSTFRNSDYYMNLPKGQKRKLNKSKLQEELMTRKSIKKYWREEYRPIIKDKQKHIRNCFIHIKRTESNCIIDNSDSDDDNSA